MKPSGIRSTWVAGAIVALLVFAAAAVPFIGRQAAGSTILLHARMAEDGGWTPASLQAQAGQPLHLRLTSDDVMHSFAIGQSEMAPVDVAPGEVTVLTLTFDKPGKYTYYCTRWCGPNHWRMRGVIEVSGPDNADQPPEPPLYVTLGLDIDQPHPAAVTPAAPPSVVRGEELIAQVPSASLLSEYTTKDYSRTHSPAETWQALRAEASLEGFSDQQLWDLAAALVQSQTTPEMLSEGRRLYAENCAACHGENGAGDGVMAESLASEPMPGMDPGQMTTAPADFSDPGSMLGASPAVLNGKIVRGGMGTGMPYWGPIFTGEQIWALVAYIQSLQFETENQP